MVWIDMKLHILCSDIFSHIQAGALERAFINIRLKKLNTKDIVEIKERISRLKIIERNRDR